MAPNPPSSRLVDQRWACLLLAVLAVAAYAGTLGNQFTFDDRAIIETDPSTANSQSLARLVISPYWTGEGRANRLYRPVTSLSFALNGILGGARPWTFHLVNLLLHALVCIVLYLLLWPVSWDGLSCCPPCSFGLRLGWSGFRRAPGRGGERQRRSLRRLFFFWRSCRKRMPSPTQRSPGSPAASWGHRKGRAGAGVPGSWQPCWGRRAFI